METLLLLLMGILLFYWALVRFVLERLGKMVFGLLLPLLFFYGGLWLRGCRGVNILDDSFSRFFKVFRVNNLGS